MKIQNIIGLVAIVVCCVSISTMRGVQKTQDFLEGKIGVDSLLRYIVEAGIYNSINETASNLAYKIMTAPKPNDEQAIRIKKECGYIYSPDLWQELKQQIIEEKRKMVLPIERFKSYTMEKKVALFEKNVIYSLIQLDKCGRYIFGAPKGEILNPSW
jgi:hypothetical protein